MSRWNFPRLRRFGLNATRRAFPAAPLRVAAVRWLVLVVGVGALGRVLYRSERNLALDKPVRMSSNCELRPPHSPVPVEPSRLVDGMKSRPYDACTQRKRKQWVWLDLQVPARIDSVVVTGRRDCCWNHRDLPLVLELSDDDAEFAEVARRELPFSDREPWRVELPGAHGRYLRLRVDAKQATEIVLTEIEVFGAPLAL